MSRAERGRLEEGREAGRFLSSYYGQAGMGYGLLYRDCGHTQYLCGWSQFLPRCSSQRITPASAFPITHPTRKDDSRMRTEITR